jgi:hypothetical protein
MIDNLNLKSISIPSIGNANAYVSFSRLFIKDVVSLQVEIMGHDQVEHIYLPRTAEMRDKLIGMITNIFDIPDDNKVKAPERAFDAICRYNEHYQYDFKIGTAYSFYKNIANSNEYSSNGILIHKARILEKGEWPSQAHGSSGWWFEKV